METRGRLLACLAVASLLQLGAAGLVKVIRQRRDALNPAPVGAPAAPAAISPASTATNATFPSPDHPVVFNHVYNVNVPHGALCTVDLDSPGGVVLVDNPSDAPSEQHTEHTVNAENQIVFTHRINIPREACGCSDGLPGLKDLLGRLEMLEGEVSTLRDQCTTGAGCCSAHQATGVVGTKPFCNGHGNYSTGSCGCVCEPGWTGPNCTEVACPNHCQDQGRCVDGKCVCFEGFTGDDCNIEVCPVDCGDHGQCVDGACVCADGYSGEDCSETDCLNNCLGRGACVDGDCICDDPWGGFDCSELICPNDCFDRGRCINGTCYCDEGFTGEDCGELTCPNNCNYRGFCVDGKCVCGEGFTGDDCSKLTCPSDCNKRGHCFNGMCICDPGYEGEDCSKLSCPKNCHGRGLCVEGKCVCDVGFEGKDCGELSCLNNCLNRGRCVNGQCVCDEGFAGEDCGVKTCPNDCYGRGDCVDGKCVCYAGFTGLDCSELTCPNDCLGRGKCVHGMCVCDEGFEEGFEGDDCSVLSCPENCSGRGRCENGVCVCDDGYMGEDCGELRCLNDCNNNGRCVNGLCVCDDGYIGDDCSEVSPPTDLTVTEVTPESVNLTWANEMIVTEYLITYVPTSPGGLLLDFRVPGDWKAANIDQLEPGIEYLINVYAILNNKQSIPVSARVATHLPEPEGLKFKSLRETSVEVLWDKLDISFDGWHLTFRNTKEENGAILNTLDSTETSYVQTGLGPGLEYEVKLEVVKNKSRGPPASEIITTKLDSPSQLEVRDVTDTSAVVSWFLPVAQVDGVSISYGPSADSSERNTVELSNTDTQYSLESLAPDTEYEVFLVSRRGEMRSDPVREIFTTDLDAPTDLEVVEETDETVTLEWQNSKAAVESYQVKYSTLTGAQHGVMHFLPSAGDITLATITGLSPGTEYGIGVSAVKEDRESLPATTNAATDLDAPKGLEVSESTETTLTIVWKKPQAKISIYRLIYFSTDGSMEELEIPGTDTTYTLTKLVPGMLYTISLVAKRGSQKSEPADLSASTASFTFYLADYIPELTTTISSEENFFSLMSVDDIDPDSSGIGREDPEMMALTVSGVTSSGFLLSWESQIVHDSFTVECRDSMGLWDVMQIQLPGDAIGTRIEGLKASTAYQPDSLAEPNSAAELNSRAEANSTTELNSTAKLNAMTEPNSTAEPEFTAEPNSTAEPEFTAEPNSTAEHATAHAVTEPGDSWNAQVNGLSPSTLYEVNVYGTPEGERNSSLPTLATAEEHRPLVGNLTISDLSWDSFSLSWNPEDAEYEMFLTEIAELEGGQQVANYSLSGDARSLGISGLNPDTTYRLVLYGVHKGQILEPAFAEVTTVLTIEVGWAGRRSCGLLPRNPPSHRLDPAPRLPPLPKSECMRPSPICALCETEPVVGGLYVSNITSESFSISWNGTEGNFEGFVLEIIDSSWLMESMEYNLSHNALSYEITGLNPSTDYIAYLNGVIKGVRTDAVSTVATTAAEPDLDRLVVSNITSDRLSLSWRTGGKNFDNIVVEVRESALPSQATGHTLSGGARSTVITGLKGATGYDIKLYGRSGRQNTLPLTAAATTEAEPQLGMLAVSGITPSNFTVSWVTVAGHFDSFVIRVSDSEQLYDTLDLRAAGDARNASVTGLVDSTHYDVILFGISHGRRTPSLSAHARTAELPKVENLNISDIDPFGFRVSWTARDGGQSDGFDHFQIEVTDSGWLLNPQEFTVAGDQSSLDISGLITGIGYEVRLTGVSRSGLSSRTLTAVAVTEAEPEVEHLFVSDITPEGFRLAWTAEEDVFDTFVIKVRDSKRLETPQEHVVSGEERTKVISGLTGGTEYEIELYGITLEWRSQPITTVARTGVGAPMDISFSDVTETTANVLWTIPRTRVDSFRVSYTPAEGGTPIVMSVDGSETMAALSSLIPGMTYFVTIVTVRGLEESEPVTGSVTTALDKPSGLRVINVTDTEALLLWQPAIATVDGYVITYSADTVPPVMEHVSGNTVEFEMSSLAPGTRYTVMVHAVREAEKSGAATTDFTTDVDPPRDLAASKILQDRATLTWTAPLAAITGYSLSLESADGTVTEVPLGPTETSYSLSKLIDSTEYTVKLQAIAGEKRSRIISSVFSTSVGAPMDISFSDVTETTANVLWTIPRTRVDSFRVSYTPAEGGTPMVMSVDGSENMAALSSLIPGMTYFVTVVAVRGLEESEPVTGSVTTALDKPSGLRAINVTDTEALLLWQPAIATVDGYVITYSADTVPPVMEHVSGNTVEFEMSSLAPGTRYTVMVHAVREAEKSGAATTDFTTDVDPPRDLAASKILQHRATLTWTAPLAAITGYSLSLESADGTVTEVPLGPTETSYSLSKLTASTEYTVKLQAIAGEKRSRIISSVFSTIGVLYIYPKDCSQALLNGDSASGLYTIYIGGAENKPIQVYCDMTTDGGGWIVFLRRQNGKLDFFRNWRNYSAGFGDLNDEFWLGLGNLHKISTAAEYELRVDLRDLGEEVYAQYDKFVVNEPRGRYKINLGSYSGTAGDSLTYHQGRPFSTYDNDNDIAVTNCALSYKGAFWYKNCHRVNVMGRYGDHSHSKGVNWFHWKGHEHSLEFVEMKMRPANFRNFEGRRKRS
ncbi:hypothetical protein SKAU_G00362090 [Synaphobranchus kaupii]|uniref:Tenascin n=1 Tax=Synaphobranchus kaupii TaxID=118154 RepID=A0A9Q1EIL4_SYNKA|nr:hypothetical protein SKAU_G00362090 [Synaphobranchus kaupii]